MSANNPAVLPAESCREVPEIAPISQISPLVLTCRAVCTDHGAFVVINVYCPNAGPAPERPRLAIKMRFLEALKRKADALASAGREARRLTAEQRCAPERRPSLQYSTIWLPATASCTAG